MKLEIVTVQGLVFKWHGNRAQAKLLLAAAENAVLSYERAQEARLALAKLKVRKASK